MPALGGDGRYTPFARIIRVDGRRLRRPKRRSTCPKHPTDPPDRCARRWRLS
ncbi:hypothetical protein GCM10023322_73630 [Rugosimonospora acidiphila]|uniref:Uncharacterized protein n=1 Tax=Rugosimonospora acidiphila TaxID=556531 RepID=A0ABP9SPP0_9ACTN